MNAYYFVHSDGRGAIRLDHISRCYWVDNGHDTPILRVWIGPEQHGYVDLYGADADRLSGLLGMTSPPRG